MSIFICYYFFLLNFSQFSLVLSDNSLSSASCRLLELHSPDGQHTVVLRCKDGPTANSWFTAVHTNIAALLPQTLAHVNAYLGASSAASTHPHLKHIGWLAEQVWEYSAVNLFIFLTAVCSFSNVKCL